MGLKDIYMNRNNEAYADVVARLAEYRKKMRLSQHQMGIFLNVTQAHYSKLESGMKIISKSSLLHFQDKGGDAHWLITGESQQIGIFDTYFDHFPDNDGTSKQAFFEAVLWIVDQGIRIVSNLGPETDGLDKIFKIVRCLLHKDRNYSLWAMIREIENLTQVQMADILDVNIKRYRRLEKGEADEDAGILTSLYINLGYSPMLLLKRDMYCTSRLNAIWETFDQKLQNRLLQYVIKSHELVSFKYEGNDGKEDIDS